MSETLMRDIKNGVDGMIKGHSELKDRVKEVEESVSRMWTVQKNYGGVSLPGLEAERSRFSFVKASAAIGFQAMGQNDAWTKLGAGFEKEVLDQATKKAMDTGTGGAGGGYVVPVEYSREVIKLLRAKARVVQAGATVLEDLSGSPFVVPKQLTSGTVYWVGQNANITASDASFGQVILTPKTMAMRTQFSNLLNILSNPSMEELIRNDFARVGALELDRVALRGSGTSNQPLGINGVSGLQSLAIGTNGGAFSFDVASQALMLLDSASALDGKIGFVTHPRISWKMRRERIANYSGQTDGSYVVPPIISENKLNDMLGAPMYSTTQLPINLVKGTSSDCSEVYIGNWADLLIGIWGNLEILATNIGGNAWTQNAIEVRMIWHVDVNVRNGESFVLCNDARI